MRRRHFIAACAGALALPGLARASGFPGGQPIRVVVGFAPGGPTDTQARTLAEALSRELGTPVLVENRPGASGVIGLQAVMQAKPDGHTLLYTIDGPLTLLPHTMPSLSYDPLTAVTPIARTALGGSVLLIHPSVPAATLPEFLAYARAHKGELSYASYGMGSLAHIYGEVLSTRHDLGLTHVPYKGSSEAVRDLLAGRVQVMFDSPATSLQYVEEGRLRRLGATGESRRTLIPDLPTLGEQGLPGFELRSWNAFFGPPGLPPERREQLNAALQTAMRSDLVRGVWAAQGFEHVSEPTAEFDKVLTRDHGRWGEYVRELGIRVEG